MTSFWSPANKTKIFPRLEYRTRGRIDISTRFNFAQASSHMAAFNAGCPVYLLRHPIPRYAMQNPSNIPRFSIRFQLRQRPPSSLEPKSLRLHSAPATLQRRAIRPKIGLLTIEEVFPPNAAAVAHASEDTALLVEVDRRVELGDVTGVHDEDAVVADDGAESVG